MEAIFSGVPAFHALKQCAVDLPQNNADEKVLLSRCRAGELAAFDVMLGRYRERVLNLAFIIGRLCGKRWRARNHNNLTRKQPIKRYF